MSTPPTQPALRGRLPWPLRLLAAGFGLYSLSGWVRLWQTLEVWPYLVALELRPGPQFLAISGAVTGLVGLLGVLVIWLRPRWGPAAVTGLALLAAALFWGEALWFVNPAQGLSNWPFSVGITLALLALVLGLAGWWSLRNRRRA